MSWGRICGFWCRMCPMGFPRGGQGCWRCLRGCACTGGQPSPPWGQAAPEALMARDATLHTSQTRLLLARDITHPRHPMSSQIPFPCAIG